MALGKIEKLQALAGTAAFPESDPFLAQQMMEARKVQLQALGKQRAEQEKPQVTAAERVATLAQPLQAIEQQQVKMSAAKEAVSTSAMARMAQQKVSEERANLSSYSQEQARKLDEISLGLRASMVDQELRFKTDEAGRKLFSQRQLADWSISNAREESEHRARLQMVEQISRKKLLLLETAEKKLQQALEENSIRGNTIRSNDTRIELARMAAEARKAAERERSKQAARGAMYAAAGSILGAVVGVAVSAGNPAGAPVGAAIGGAVGTAVAAVGTSGQ